MKSGDKSLIWAQCNRHYHRWLFQEMSDPKPALHRGWELTCLFPDAIPQELDKGSSATRDESTVNYPQPQLRPSWLFKLAMAHGVQQLGTITSHPKSAKNTAWQVFLHKLHTPNKAIFAGSFSQLASKWKQTESYNHWKFWFCPFSKVSDRAKLSYPREQTPGTSALSWESCKEHADPPCGSWLSESPADMAWQPYQSNPKTKHETPITSNRWECAQENIDPRDLEIVIERKTAETRGQLTHEPQCKSQERHIHAARRLRSKWCHNRGICPWSLVQLCQREPCNG